MKQLNVIADGDSWCDYPWILGTGGGLPEHLSSILGVPVLNIAHAGDSSEESLGLAKTKRLEAIMPSADILLFSSGGDDIAGDQFYIWLNQNTDGDIAKAINMDRLTANIDLIIADYQNLFELRDRVAPDCLIITHSYDRPPARVMGKGVLFLGPWLQPGLIFRGWTDIDDQVAIVAIALGEFQRRMAAFAATTKGHIHVNTQGTCAPEDWQNELHLESSGWDKVAKQINLALLPFLNTL